MPLQSLPPEGTADYSVIFGEGKKGQGVQIPGFDAMPASEHPSLLPFRDSGSLIAITSVFACNID